MNKYSVIILSSCFLHAASLCMESTRPGTEPSKKITQPIDWEQFDWHNLQAYTAQELNPLLVSAISQKAPIRVVKEILDKTKDPNATDAVGNPLLALAILHDNEPAAQELVSKGATLIYERDRFGVASYTQNPNGFTPWQATFASNKKQYIQLIYDRISQDDRDRICHWRIAYGNSPLKEALKAKNEELADYLLSIKPELLTGNLHDEMLRLLAAFPNTKYLAMLYLEKPEEMCTQFTSSILLEESIRAKNPATTQLVLAHNPRITQEHIVEAALAEDGPLVKQLVQKGPPLNTHAGEHEYGWFHPLFVCLGKTNYSSAAPLQALLEAGADANAKNYGMETPLIDACKNARGSVTGKIITALLTHGAQINITDDQGSTALHFASAWQKCDACFHLLDKGADPNIPNKKNVTPFTVFCATNTDPHRLARFLDYNPIINTSLIAQHTPLTAVAGAPAHAMALVTMLAAKGADIEANKDQMLLRACRADNLNVALLLLEKYQANPNTQTTKGNSPLYKVIAVDRSGFYNEETNYDALRDFAQKLTHGISLLMRHGAHINSKNEKGKTVLHKAISNRISLEAFNHLLSFNPKVNAVDNAGKTALSYCVRFAQPEYITPLIKKGANPYALNEEGKTVIQEILEQMKERRDDAPHLRTCLHLMYGGSLEKGNK